MTEAEHDEDNPFVMTLGRLSNNGVEVTVRGQRMELTEDDAKWLLDSLQQWYYPLGRDVDLTQWQFDDASPQAQQRGTHSADAVFEGAGLDRDDPGMEAAYASVRSWFAKNDEPIRAMERGEDDGCPCEDCRDRFGPLPKQR